MGFGVTSIMALPETSCRPEAPLQYSGLLEFLNTVAIGDNWCDAELWCPLTYVYGSKHLHLPPELKQAVSSSCL